MCNDFMFPSYDDVSNLIKDDLQLSAEYGISNHNNLNKLWEHIHDKDVIRMVGEEINNRGGGTALRANYYILLQIMRPCVKHNHEKYINSWYDIKTHVSKTWDGIGDWRH